MVGGACDWQASFWDDWVVSWSIYWETPKNQNMGVFFLQFVNFFREKSFKFLVKG